MRILSLLILLSLIAYTGSSQIRFEAGYFITKTGDSVRCLIKNLDWKNNPNEFQYRDQRGESQVMQIKEIQEFGIFGQLKYKTLTVKIDRSEFSLVQPTFRNPVFSEDTLALRVLVEGSASLYYYESNNIYRFFLMSAIQQLNSLYLKSISMNPVT